MLLTRGPAALGMEFSLHRVETVSPDYWRPCALAKVLASLSLVDKEAALCQTNQRSFWANFLISQSLAWLSAGALGWETVFLGDYFCFQPLVLVSRSSEWGLGSKLSIRHSPGHLLALQGLQCPAQPAVILHTPCSPGFSLPCLLPLCPV